MKIKLRKAIKTFFNGKILAAKYCIESKDKNRWLLLGDETSNGPLKFDTAQARDEYLTVLEAAIAKQENNEITTTKEVLKTAPFG